MNKKKVDELLPASVIILKTVEIANESGIINKTFRGQISTFGAAIVNGSLLSAIAFFSDKGSSSVDRPKLIKAIYNLIQPLDTNGNLFDYVKSKGPSKEREVKEEIINATIAIKLAMNLYTLKGGSDE